jgi:hypothetical protein
VAIVKKVIMDKIKNNYEPLEIEDYAVIALLLVILANILSVVAIVLMFIFGVIPI